MKALQLLRRNLYCLKPDHQHQTIHYICVDGECQDNQLCCFLCQQQKHKSHQMENLKFIFNKILNAQVKQSHLLALSAAMDATAIQISQILVKYKHQFVDANSVNNSFQKYLQIKRKNAISTLNFAEKLQKMAELKVAEFQTQLKQFILSNIPYFQLDELDKKQKQAAKDIYTKNLRDFNQDLNTIKSTLYRILKQNKFNDYEVLVLFPIEQDSVRIYRPHFVSAYHGPCMIVTSTTAQMKTSSSQRVLALEPCLQKGGKPKKWKVKITKLASWIGIGACHINKLKQANWFFNYSNTQHGSYFISSNGYCWSSFKPQYNSKFESFSFKTGDIVKVEFNPREKKLKYEKEGSNQTYSIDLDINGDPLHPAINLTGMGDAVEIVS